MDANQVLKTFKEIFRPDLNNINDALAELKRQGASKTDCIQVLSKELSLSLTAADEIILNSPSWTSDRDASEGFRDAFGDFLEAQK